MTVLGATALLVKVKRQEQGRTLPLLVVKAGNGRAGPNLLGRYWLAQLQLDWNQVYRLTSRVPQYYKAIARSFLYALKELVNEQLLKLERQDMGDQSCEVLGLGCTHCTRIKRVGKPFEFVVITG